MTMQGLRVLVTRPAGQADGFVQGIIDAGGQAWHQPVLTIEGLAESDKVARQQCKQRVLDLDLYQQAIFVSTNAVKFGVDWIEQYWPQLPVGVQWHAIGAATAAAMQAAGLSVCEQGREVMDSEELLAAPALQSVAGQKFLIIRGVGGRQYLSEQLRSRGAVVDYIECYQRGLPDLHEQSLAQLLDRHQINVVSVNSGESLANFCQLLGQQLSDYLTMALLVPGERVAELARQRGFSTVIVASNAGQTATLNALAQYQR